MATAAVSITPECSICCEGFTTPKFIPCGHTFCLGCIVIYIGDKTKTFHCPICQQDVNIPKGGAKMFPTNFVLQTSKHAPPVRNQHLSTTQPACPNHNQREVDYYCTNCNVGLCFRCISKQHKDHETLDVECDETGNKVIQKLERSKKIIQNRIKNLEKTRYTLLESFEHLKSSCEDSCAKVTAQTEQIVSHLRKSCEHVIKDIRKKLEENKRKVQDNVKEITNEITVLDSDMVSNISPSTSTTLNILLTFPRLIEIEKLDESRKDYNLCVQYLQWVGEDFSLDIDQLGSVIPKPFYIPGSYQFLVDVIDKDDNMFNSKNKFKCNNLVWNCRVLRTVGDDLGIGIKLSSENNPRLDYCIIDGQISVLHIDDDSKTIKRTAREKRLMRGDSWLSLCNPITWSEFTDKSNGYLTSGDQMVIQFDITQVREISWK